jgi:hypothetical protein
MRALVVFESMFGNTRAIADAVADGMASRMGVDVVEVGAAPAVIGDDVGLLVVGGPTHAFGMSRPDTRQSAVQQAPGPVVSAGSGLREWLAVVRGPAGVAVTAFDTRVIRPRMPGSAARAALRRLRRRGFRAAAPATSFYVVGTTGPLVEAEPQRARQWGEQVAAAALGTVGMDGQQPLPPGR